MRIRISPIYQKNIGGPFLKFMGGCFHANGTLFDVSETTGNGILKLL